jgi:hypothetical protein
MCRWCDQWKWNLARVGAVRGVPGGVPRSGPSGGKRGVRRPVRPEVLEERRSRASDRPSHRLGEGSAPRSFVRLDEDPVVDLVPEAQPVGQLDLEGRLARRRRTADRQIGVGRPTRDHLDARGLGAERRPHAVERNGPIVREDDAEVDTLAGRKDAVVVSLTAGRAHVLVHDRRRRPRMGSAACRGWIGQRQRPGQQRSPVSLHPVHDLERPDSRRFERGRGGRCERILRLDRAREGRLREGDGPLGVVREHRSDVSMALPPSLGGQRDDPPLGRKEDQSEVAVVGVIDVHLHLDGGRRSRVGDGDGARQSG